MLTMIIDHNTAQQRQCAGLLAAYVELVPTQINAHPTARCIMSCSILQTVVDVVLRCPATYLYLFPVTMVTKFIVYAPCIFLTFHPYINVFNDSFFPSASISACESCRCLTLTRCYLSDAILLVQMCPLP
jgi:hypothetical protein